MANATYSSGEFSGGAANDRLFLSDLAAAAGSPLTLMMEQVVRQTSAGALTVALDASSFSDLTGGLLILQNASNDQELEFRIDGDAVIGGDDGELRERDFLLVVGPYDFENIHTTQRSLFHDDAKIVVAEGSQFILRHLHTFTTLAGEPGARTGFLLENNNADSRIRVAIHSGSAARNPGQTISGNVKVNGDEIVHWGVTDQVPVRELEWIADYLDLRSAADGAPFTRATLISASGMKFLNVPFDHSVDDPLIYGAADAPFVVQLGDQASHYWLFGIVSSEADARTVFLNLDGPDLNARFSSYTGGGNKVARYEHHLVLDYTVQEPDGDAVEGAVVRVHCRRPTYSAAQAGSGNPASVTFPVGNAQVVDSTSDANGRGQIGTADGTLADAVCIEAFGRRNTNGGGNRDGAYAGADNYRAAYGSHTALQYDVFAWGKQYVVGASWNAAKSGEAGAGKQNLGALVLNDDTDVTAATKDAVVAAAATFDDIYDLLAEYAYDNNEAIAGSVANGVLQLTDADLTLALGGSASRTGGATTIPCAATLAAGTKVSSLRATGTITVAAGVNVVGSVRDASGITVLIDGFPVGHSGVVGAWPLSQGETNRANIITGAVADAAATSIRLTLAADTEYFIVADAVSYLRSSPIRLNTGTATALDVSLRRIVDAAGNDLIPSVLTAAEQAQFDRITYDITNDAIVFGGSASVQEYSFRAVARAIEVGQSSQAALANRYICLIQTGSFVLESGTARVLKRKPGLNSNYVPDLSAFQFTKIGSDSIKDFVDYDDGAIIVNNGAPSVVTISGVAEADFHRYMDTLSDAVKREFKSGSDQAANGMTYFELWQFLGGIGGGRIEDNPDDSTKYDVYSLVDDNLVATVPKFVGNTRAAGATVPTD